MKRRHGRDAVAIYHVVFAHEDFDHTACTLLQLIHKAQHDYPGKKRVLYLDIEGHRSANGGFDDDMLELQSKFTTEFLLPFLTRAIMPLVTLENPNPQKNEIPNELRVISIEHSPGEEPPEETSGESSRTPRL